MPKSQSTNNQQLTFLLNTKNVRKWTFFVRRWTVLMLIRGFNYPEFQSAFTLLEYAQN